MRLVENPYNGEQFGIRMVDLVGLSDEDAPSAREVASTIAAAGPCHVSTKIRTADKGVLNMVLGLGFRLVDTQVEYLHTLTEVRCVDPPDGCLIRDFEERDREAVESIAEGSFSVDRWHADPSLPNELCDRYYRSWIQSCIAGYAQKVLVAEEDGKACGFLALRSDGSGWARISLTAVADGQRGRGVYSALVSSALGWAREGGLSRVLATTQIDNYGSRRTWIRAGFNASDAWYVLHRGNLDARRGEA